MSAEEIKELIEAMECSETWQERGKYEEEIVAFGSNAVPALLDYLTWSRHIGGYMRYSIADILKRINDPMAVAYLRNVAAWKSVHNMPRKLAMEMLGLMEAEEAIPELKVALDSEKWDDWDSAADALGRIGDAATPVLVEALKRLPGGMNNGQKANELIRALVKAEDAFQPMFGMLKGADLEAERAKEFFVKLASRKGFDALNPLLDELPASDTATRQKIARIVAQTHCIEAIPVLVDLCWEREQTTANIAFFALKKEVIWKRAQVRAFEKSVRESKCRHQKKANEEHGGEVIMEGLSYLHSKWTNELSRKAQKFVDREKRFPKPKEKGRVPESKKNKKDHTALNCEVF